MEEERTGMGEAGGVYVEAGELKDKCNALSSYVMMGINAALQQKNSNHHEYAPFQIVCSLPFHQR
jgi:hypothetical protein